MQRVTNLGSSNAMREWIASSGRRLAESQEDIGSGVHFDRSSEAPAAAATVLRNERTVGRLGQLERNIDDAKLWLQTSDTIMNDVVASLTRARTLMVQGANEVNSPEARGAIAADIRSIRDEMLSLANSTVNGRPIFAGTANIPQSYDAAGNYLGDDGAVLRSVTTTDSFSVAATGPSVFGDNNPADPLNGSLFERLEAAAAAVDAGDVAQVRQSIESADSSMSTVQSQIGRLGGLSNRLEEVASRNQVGQIDLKSQISQLQDVDMADAILRLRSAESSYEATLSSVSRSLSRSLLDFLS
ncbi:MAG: flagellar hook-associated protein 3 FlgL [Acidimicrobiales bacterium]|jgi:flagellar hook-associated protein 3 FlgL